MKHALRAGLAVAITAALLPRAGTLAGAAGPAAPPRRPNILMIVLDDQNHWVGHLGRNPQVRTPNIDGLAGRGVTFAHAYAPAPVCNASRAALLSGIRPSSSGVYTNGPDWRLYIPQPITLPSFLRRHGYFVAGAGKIYHNGRNRRSEWDDYFGDEEGPLGGREGGPRAPEGPRAPANDAASGPDGVGGIKFRPIEGGDDALPDYAIASWTIEQLGRKHEKPFFLACGFHKPHMPWNVPKKWFDLYPLDSIELPPSLASDLDDLPEEGRQMATSLGDHPRILKSGRWKEAVQAYLATVSYADMNVGRVLDALEKSPYRDETIVVLFGDNGFHLGEKLRWRKFALWEESTRVPYIWFVPGLTRPGVSSRPVDLMTVFPTLAELAGLAAPDYLEGVSIRRLLEQPDSAWSRPALMTQGFSNHSVRTEDWRYIRYAGGGEELYNERKDPLEWTNLAGAAEHQGARAQLERWLPVLNAPSAPEPGTGGEAAAQRRQRQQ